MHILHLGKHYWPSFGGIETALRDLNEIGLALGNTATCVVAANNNERVGKQNVDGVEVNRLSTFGKFLSAPLAPSYLWVDLDEADIVHLHLPNPIAEIRVLLALLFRKGIARKLVPFLHAVPVSQGRFGKIWFGLVTKFILSRSRAILISNSSLLNVIPELREWQEKVHVLGFVAPEIRAKRVDQQRYILGFGRLVSYKGFDVLIRAFALIADSQRDIELWLGGDGPERENLERIATSLKVANRVRFLGRVDDREKENLFVNAELFAAPSISNAETFGIAILEAMAAGLAVVTTDLSTGVSELARGGACGAVVPVGDAELLAVALGDLLSNSSLRKARGEANCAFVRETYGKDQLTQIYARFLAEIGSP